MNQENFIVIGHIVKEKGLKGQVCIKFIESLKSPLPKITTLFFQENIASYIPYEVVDYKLMSDNYGVFLFKQIVNIEQAQKFKNKAIYILEKDIKQFFNKKKKDVLGFAIVALKNYQCCVEDIIDMNNTLICKTTILGKEVLLPYHPDLIINLNVSKKEIDLKIPEGLLDIYLKNNQ
ncbi:MAG: hypothetical protein QM539_04870 [Alphaproteobacteria bacterium]|nr:hypothetical protein [Alphaproteobacteria bacterium]